MDPNVILTGRRRKLIFNSDSSVMMEIILWYEKDGKYKAKKKILDSYKVVKTNKYMEFLSEFLKHEVKLFQYTKLYELSFY